MKIGIITFQLAWNCGAVLQCYALQTYLEQQGHNVEIINYRPKYKEYRYKKYCNPFIASYKEFKAPLPVQKRVVLAAKKFIRTILNYKKDSEHIRQWEGFNSFCEKYLKLTRVYTSLESLRIDPPQCDIYISGSDQLWNPKLTNETLDAAYFLDFGKNIRKITYAISACQLNMTLYGKQINRLCSSIDAVSLREHEFIDEIEACIEKKIIQCIDPTFLLSSSVYSKMVPHSFKQQDKTIIVYLLEDENGMQTVYDEIKLLQKETNCKITVICGPRHWPYEVNQIRGVLPEEFVGAIQNADYVISNSFHATAFSIIFQKKFVVLDFKGRGSRMRELLHHIGLDDRLISNTALIKDTIVREIDYIDVENRLNKLRKSSKDYLNVNCGEILK